MASREATPRAADAHVRVEGPLEPPSTAEAEEIEHGGQVYRIHAALRGAFLMQADYTRKTQELADDRRAYVADREALNSRIETLWSSLGDLVLWVALNHTGLWGADCPTPELGVEPRATTARQADSSSTLQREGTADEPVFRR